METDADRPPPVFDGAGDRPAVTARRAWWAGVVAAASGAVFAASVAAHAATFLGVDPIERVPGLMALHLATMAVFGSVFLLEPRRRRRARLDELLPHAPAWMRLAVRACLVYTVVNFALFIYLTREGSPVRRPTGFALEHRAHVVREITAAEFHRRQALEVRGFSGHWMLFSSFALATA